MSASIDDLINFLAIKANPDNRGAVVVVNVDIINTKT